MGGEERRESWGAGRTGLPPVGLPGKGLPVRSIYGCAFATRSTVTAIGPIGGDGCLPGHLFDHLVQVPNPALGWSHTCHRRPKALRFYSLSRALRSHSTTGRLTLLPELPPPPTPNTTFGGEVHVVKTMSGSLGGCVI